MYSQYIDICVGMKKTTTGSYHCLLVNLDHLITSMDLPGQVCR